MAIMDVFTITGIICVIAITAVIITLCNSSDGCNKPV